MCTDRLMIDHSRFVDLSGLCGHTHEIEHTLG